MSSYSDNPDGVVIIDGPLLAGILFDLEEDNGCPAVPVFVAAEMRKMGLYVRQPTIWQRILKFFQQKITKDSHMFSTKNNSVFVIFVFQNLTNR